MATLAQLETALVNADKAGDSDAARKIAAAIKAARSDSANLIPGSVIPETIPQAPEPSLLDQAAGVGEAGLTLATGATGGALGMIGGTLKGLAEQILAGNFGTPEAQRAVEESASRGAQSLTYAPHTQSGQEMAQSAGEVLQNLIPIAPLTGQIGMAAQAAKTAAPSALVAGTAAANRIAVPVAGAVQRVKQAIKPIETARTGPQSGGAAATPLERQRATEAQMAGLKLSEGETKRSPELLAWEKEKAKTPEYQAQFLERQQENNRAALAKFSQVLDDTGAETGDLSNTGIKVVDTLMKGWKDEKAKTSKLYNSFRSSPEYSLPVDSTPVLDFINEQPVGVPGITGVTDVARQNAIKLGIASMDDSGRLTALPATLGKLEDFRQSVSAIGASSPNDSRLISTLKRTVDDVGDPIGGHLTKAMRAQRTRQAQKYENRAIVSQLLLEKKGMSDPRVPIEDVFRKTIVSARPSEITHIKRVLHTVGGDEGRQAWKELQGATIRHLEESASSGIGSDNLPVISAAKLDRAITSLDQNGKLDLVLGKSAAEEVRNLNQVLKYIQSTPPLTSINNSGTARTVMALLAESAATGAATGIPLPVIQGLKILRNEIKDRKIKARITKALNYKPEGF